MSDLRLPPHERLRLPTERRHEARQGARDPLCKESPPRTARRGSRGTATSAPEPRHVGRVVVESTLVAEPRPPSARVRAFSGTASRKLRRRSGSVILRRERSGRRGRRARRRRASTARPVAASAAAATRRVRAARKPRPPCASSGWRGSRTSASASAPRPCGEEGGGEQHLDGERDGNPRRACERRAPRASRSAATASPERASATSARTQSASPPRRGTPGAAAATCATRSATRARLVEGAGVDQRHAPRRCRACSAASCARGSGATDGRHLAPQPVEGAELPSSAMQRKSCAQAR